MGSSWLLRAQSSSSNNWVLGGRRCFLVPKGHVCPAAILQDQGGDGAAQHSRGEPQAWNIQGESTLLPALPPSSCFVQAKGGSEEQPAKKGALEGTGWAQSAGSLPLALQWLQGSGGLSPLRPFPGGAKQLP